MKKEKGWLVWSGGADAAVTLFETKSPEYKLQGILGLPLPGVSVPEAYLKSQGESLELPYKALETTIEQLAQETWPLTNEEDLRALFKQKKTEALIFTFHKDSPLVKAAVHCANYFGLNARFPLWNWPSEEILRVFFNLKFDAVIVSVDERKIPPSFLGQSFERKLLERFPKGVDSAGLLGEFGLYVFNGPFFQQTLPSRFENPSKMGNYLSFDFKSP